MSKVLGRELNLVLANAYSTVKYLFSNTCKASTNSVADLGLLWQFLTSETGEPTTSTRTRFGLIDHVWWRLHATGGSLCTHIVAQHFQCWPKILLANHSLDMHGLLMAYTAVNLNIGRTRLPHLEYCALIIVRDRSLIQCAIVVLFYCQDISE